MANGKRSEEHKQNHAEGVKRAAVERKDAAQAVALISERKDRALAIRGKDKPITDDIREEALIMLANGNPMDRVCDHFGIDRCSLLVNGNRDPEFSSRLKDAMALGTVELINSTFRVAAGEDGYSSGSIERDKLITDMAWRYAKTIGNRIFGDKLQIDQRSITITVNRDEGDW